MANQNYQNPAGTPYPSIHELTFSPATQLNARGIGTPLPQTRNGVTTFPQFDKASTGHIPTLKIIISNLIRGNSTG